MKITHLISGDLWAGAEVMSFNLLKGLRRREDLDVSAILLNEGILADNLRGLGIPVTVCREEGKSFPRLLREVKSALDRLSPDVVHSHRYKENTLAFAATLTAPRIRRVATLHGMPELFQHSLRHSLATMIDRFLISRYFHKVAVVSNDMKKTLVDSRGFAEGKIRVIHNGIEVPEITHKAVTDVCVIGSSGRLYPVKDYPLMVDMAKAIFSTRTDVRFELAGDGVERANLARLISRHGLHDVFYLKGFLRDLSAFYRRLDLYVNTSIHEGIPLSVLEAMAHGVPVIAPMVGGLGEIITDGVDGFLVEGRRPEDFARRCLDLLEASDMRLRMGISAREKVVNEFSFEKMTASYVKLYEN